MKIIVSGWVKWQANHETKLGVIEDGYKICWLHLLTLITFNLYEANLIQQMKEKSAHFNNWTLYIYFVCLSPTDLLYMYFAFATI